jgi:hypothetical protein
MSNKNMDTTVIYYTCNKIKEPFAGNVRKQLLAAKGDLPLISVSQEPIDFGQNILFPKGQSIHNIYRQILVGAKAAKTKYVAMAEDDILYSRDHFLFTPPEGVFAYDMCKWSLYTWGNPPTFSLKLRKVLSMMICNRELLIEAAEERFAKCTNENENWGEFGRYEENIGVTKRETCEYWSRMPSIIISHPDALGFGAHGTRKGLGFIRAYEVPNWGKASDVLNSVYYDK